MHVPVLLNEAIDILNLQAGEFFIDGTLGEGGHAAEILRRIAGGKFLGVDWDKEAVERFMGKKKESRDVEIFLQCDNYANLSEILKRRKLDKADGLLIDLGFSSDQLQHGRGFSFLKPNEPLLMTYSEKEKPLYEVLKGMKEEEIVSAIRDLSDERYAERIGKAIYEREKRKPIMKVGELTDVIRGAVPKGYERGRINPSTRTFMAFRMLVNGELGNLRKLLQELPEILVPHGRAAIISFHSNEDRIVKSAFKDLERREMAEILTKKVVKPAWEEVKRNPRSRGAKLRAIEIK
ncbi:MAG: 16S rRNA (cytosine(1402)-N(4))-methyltransferase RsmH [Candidatus Colwellbacteria bacterium]|nr:16S rRNA (cytosine(1402)-N(4))-methyltransferase RsmH [Candidatus Colwellbacteria bacterium]